jgi:hypothetical protein
MDGPFLVAAGTASAPGPHQGHAPPACACQPFPIMSSRKPVASPRADVRTSPINADEDGKPGSGRCQGSYVLVLRSTRGLIQWAPMS